MIKITTYHTNPTNYRTVGFQVVGHATDSKLCAIISAIVVGGLNNIYNKNDFMINNEKGFVSILPKSLTISPHDFVVVETILKQLVGVNRTEAYRKKIDWTARSYSEEMRKGDIF
jgi:uncharacterized protein YsxB (DUF464 family)